MVWLVGVALLMATGVSIMAWLSREPDTRMLPPLWDSAITARAYTSIVGTLAGFTVASAIFLSSQTVSRGPEAFATVIGMLLVAFLALVGAAMEFGSIPGGKATLEETEPTLQRAQNLSFLLGAAAYYAGISIAWLALRPLLLALGLPGLAELFGWLLLIVVIAAAVRIGLFPYRLTQASTRACFALAPLGLGLGLGYRLLAIPFPALLPERDGPLVFTVLLFLTVGAGYLAQSALYWGYGNSRADLLVSRFGDRLAVAYLETVILSVALLWLAVAVPFG
jgi:hypothetical protein